MAALMMSGGLGCVLLTLDMCRCGSAVPVLGALLVLRVVCSMVACLIILVSLVLATVLCPVVSLVVLVFLVFLVVLIGISLISVTRLPRSMSLCSRFLKQSLLSLL